MTHSFGIVAYFVCFGAYETSKSLALYYLPSPPTTHICDIEKSTTVTVVPQIHFKGGIDLSIGVATSQKGHIYREFTLYQ